MTEALPTSGRSRCAAGVASARSSKLRFDCVSEHLGRTWLWVDMTKVGKLDYAIQIPRDIYDLVRARQHKTLARFRARTGRDPSAAERRTIALFPSPVANPSSERSLSTS